MKVVFQIQITSNHLFQCKYIPSQSNESKETKETIIQLPQNPSEYYSPIISFDKNKIKICQEHQTQTITFFDDWIEHPENFSTYEIQFQNKTYHLLPEVLFAMIINEFKQKVDKNYYFIEETIVEIHPIQHQLAERMIISLESIGLKNITINTFDYDYSEQGEQLYELLSMKQKVDNFERRIERAKEIDLSLRDKLEQIDVNNQEMIDDFFTKELANKLSIAERDKLKLYSIDNYCIFIASRYLENIDDHINLVKVSKRMQNNMEKFHYNPISLNNFTLSWFPNVETLHLYENDDEYLEGGRIERYVEWRTINYRLKQTRKEFYENKTIEFKTIVWSKENTKEALKNNDHEVIIPEGVIKLYDNCFKDYKDSLRQLTIPSTVKIIPKYCVKECYNLRNITLPLNENHIIIGNKIFMKKKSLEEYICLPCWIETINGKEVDNSNINIPTWVTTLDGYDLSNFSDMFSSVMEQLSIPSTIQNISKNSLSHLYGLTNLSIPLKDDEIICANKIFSTKKQQLKQVYSLPKSLKIINNKEVDGSKLIIPTTVTSLDNKCFDSLHLQLTKLVIPETIETIPGKLLKKLQQLKKLTVPQNFILCKDKVFYVRDHCLYSFHIPYSVEKINKKERKRLEMFTIRPSNITKLSDYCFENCKLLREINGLEYIEEFGRGCFIDCPLLNTQKYPIIKQNNEEYFNKFITQKERKQLEYWTELSYDKILLHSDSNDLSPLLSFFWTYFPILDRSIRNKFAIVLQEKDGEKFGIYIDKLRVKNWGSVDQPEEYEKCNINNFIDFEYFEEIRSLCYRSATSVYASTGKRTFYFNLNSSDKVSKSYQKKCNQTYDDYCYDSSDDEDEDFSKQSISWSDNSIVFGSICLEEESCYCRQNNELKDKKKNNYLLCNKFPKKDGKITFKLKRYMIIQMK